MLLRVFKVTILSSIPRFSDQLGVLGETVLAWEWVELDADIRGPGFVSKFQFPTHSSFSVFTAISLIHVIGIAANRPIVTLSSSLNFLTSCQSI